MLAHLIVQNCKIHVVSKFNYKQSLSVITFTKLDEIEIIKKSNKFGNTLDTFIHTKRPVSYLQCWQYRPVNPGKHAQCPVSELH